MTTKSLRVDNIYATCLRRSGTGGEQPWKRGGGRFDPGLINVVLGDGSVCTLSTDLSIEVFANLRIIAGDEVVGEF